MPAPLQEVLSGWANVNVRAVKFHGLGNGKTTLVGQKRFSVMSNLRHKPPGLTRTQLAQEGTRVGPTSMFGVVENELAGNRTALGLGGEQTLDVTRTSSVLSRELIRGGPNTMKVPRRT